MISPNSRIIILKTPMELNDKNQLTFANATAQYNYFYGLTKVELDNATFQRKDEVIRFETDEDFTFDDVLLYNYCMYQNTSYGNRWFYAYITDVTYKSDGMSELKIKTDVFQTYQFDVTWKQSFVEREHIAKANDTIGANTIPENLETGEYISTKLQPTNNDFGDTCYCVSTTKKWLSSYTILNQDLPTGTYYQGFDSIQGIYDFLERIDQNDGGASVVSVFVCPKSFFSSWGTVTDIAGNVSTNVNFTIPSTRIEITHVNYLGNDYSPKNAKLLTYPFSFLQVSNHSGTVINYHWEDFDLLSAAATGKYEFLLGCTLTVGCSGYVYPINYKNILNNYDEGIAFGKFPVGGWNTDSYTNWLTQNGVNIALNTATGVISTATGVLTGNPIGIASGTISIAQTLGSVYEHSLMPPQANGNVNAGDFNFSHSWLSLEFKRISLKNEYAQIIDDYFSMYGYATHKVKIPNFNNRSNWNYIKTINCNVIGDIPQTDLEEYRKLFDDGITLWHTTTHFLDYSQTNS